MALRDVVLAVVHDEGLDTVTVFSGPSESNQYSSWVSRW